MSGFNGVATEIKHKHDPFFEKVDVRAKCEKVRHSGASSVVAVEKGPGLMAHAQWLYHVAALRLLGERQLWLYREGEAPAEPWQSSAGASLSR